MLFKKDEAAEMKESLNTLLEGLEYIRERTAAVYGCTYTQGNIMAQIGKSPLITLVQLAKILEVNKSAASRSVEELLKRGFVTRDQDEQDRRYVKIKLTEKGEAAVKGIEADYRKQLEQVLKGVPDFQRKMVLEGLALLSQAVEKAMKHS